MATEQQAMEKNAEVMSILQSEGVNDTDVDDTTERVSVGNSVGDSESTVWNGNQKGNESVADSDKTVLAEDQENKIKQLENQINDMTGELERKDNNSNRLISEKQQLIDLLKGKDEETSNMKEYMDGLIEELKQYEDMDRKSGDGGDGDDGDGNGSTDGFTNDEKKTIPHKIAVYDSMLERINEEIMGIKNGLDAYQDYLGWINSTIQITVISSSIISSFCQALASLNINISTGQVESTSENINETQLLLSEPTLEKSTYAEDYLPIITLTISTTSALLIAIERHFSFEERQGNVNNLKGLYSELISRIKYYREYIKPWKTPYYYTDEDTSDKKKEWHKMLQKIDLEYGHIIDIKRELYTSYEKIVTTSVYDKYKKYFRYKEENSNSQWVW